MAGRLTPDEVKASFGKISNWGRWGKEDQRGALNFISAEKRAAAARLAKAGEIVSLALPLSTQTTAENPQPVQHMMLHVGPQAVAAWTTSASLRTEWHLRISTRCVTSSGTARCTTVLVIARSVVLERRNVRST